MRSFTHAARCVLPVIAMLVVPAAGFAQGFVCQTIRVGESAPQAARRVTGDSRNTYKASFQIMNAASRFIPKSQYDRIRPGWQACVIKPAVVERASLNVERVNNAIDPRDSPDGSASVVASASRVPLEAVAASNALAIVDAAKSRWMRRVGGSNLAIVWLGAAMVVPLFGWRIVDAYLTRMKTRSIIIRYFADRFVYEFRRPLVRYGAGDRPVRARLRGGLRGRFAILLAPGDGRRYPNLSDHKKNVEYDVARVLQVLGDDSFVIGPISAEAEWVVVPFQCLVPGRGSERGTIDSKQAGVTCISSF